MVIGKKRTILSTVLHRPLYYCDPDSGPAFCCWVTMVQKFGIHLCFLILPVAVYFGKLMGYQFGIAYLKP